MMLSKVDVDIVIVLMVMKDGHMELQGINVHNMGDIQSCSSSHEEVEIVEHLGEICVHVGDIEWWEVWWSMRAEAMVQCLCWIHMTNKCSSLLALKAMLACQLNLQAKKMDCQLPGVM